MARHLVHNLTHFVLLCHILNKWDISFIDSLGLAQPFVFLRFTQTQSINMHAHARSLTLVSIILEFSLLKNKNVFESMLRYLANSLIDLTVCCVVFELKHIFETLFFSFSTFLRGEKDREKKQFAVITRTPKSLKIPPTIVYIIIAIIRKKWIFFREKDMRDKCLLFI